MQTIEQINTRADQLRAEIKTLEDHKKANPLSPQDNEGVSDAYQDRLEINWQLSDLYDELMSLDEPLEPDNVNEDDAFPFYH